MAINIIVHGVTTGFDTNESNYPPFIQSFYNRPNGESCFIAEILRDATGVKSCYTLYMSNNVSNYSNRAGSYFGISVIIDNNACLDVKALYSALLSTFSNSIVGTVLEKQGSGYRYKVGSFAAAADIINTAVEKLFGQIQNTLKTSHAPIDSTYHLSSGNLSDWNPADLTDSDVNKIIKRDGGIKLSNEYPMQAQKKLLDEERRKRQQEAEAARAEMERQKALAEKRLAEERERAARQAKQLTDEVKATADRITRESREKVRAVENKFGAEIADLRDQLAKKDGVIRSYNDEYVKLATAIEQLNKRIADHQADGYKGYGSEMKRLADGYSGLSERIATLETKGVGRTTAAPVDGGGQPPVPKPNPHRGGDSKKLYLILGGVILVILIALIVIFASGESSDNSNENPAEQEQIKPSDYNRKVDKGGKIDNEGNGGNTGGFGTIWGRLQDQLPVDPDGSNGYEALEDPGSQYNGAYPLPIEMLNEIKITISDKLYGGNRKISLRKASIQELIKEALPNKRCEVVVSYPDGTAVYSEDIRGYEFQCDFKPEGLVSHSHGGTYNDYQVKMIYDFGTFERKNNETTFIP